VDVAKVMSVTTRERFLNYHILLVGSASGAAAAGGGALVFPSQRVSGEANGQANHRVLLFVCKVDGEVQQA
jgi:hypothetical protein